MKFSEAMRELEAGKKVRSSFWPQNQFYSLQGDEDGRFPDLHFPYVFLQEWELYENIVKPLSFADVVKGLKEGKNFKRISWSKGCFINSSKDTGWSILFSGDYITLTLEDLEANDWVLVS